MFQNQPVALGRRGMYRSRLPQRARGRLRRGGPEVEGRRGAGHGHYGPGVKLTLSNVAAPSLVALCEHSKRPTVADVGMVVSDLFTRTDVQVTPSGETYALNELPERTSFIQTLGKL